MNDANGTVKKVGIITGVVLILIFIGVFVIAKTSAEKKEKDKNEPKNDVVQTQEPSQNIQSEPEVKEPEIQIVEKEVVKEVVKEITMIQDIEESSLPSNFTTTEVLVKIAKKGIMLLNHNPEGDDQKELVCYFKCYGPSGEDLDVFINKSVYDVYNVNDMLMVEYSTYTNAGGLTFPLVVSVKDPNKVETSNNKVDTNINNNETEVNSEA